MTQNSSLNLDELRQLCGLQADSQLRAGGEEGLTDATLRRWLVARKGDVASAAKDLQAHAAWRVQYAPKGRIYAEEVQGEIDQDKAFLPGYDKAGRPFTIVVVSRHQMKDTEMSKRFIAYTLDCATLMGSTRSGWDGKMSGIFDLRGLKAANCDFSTLRNVFDLLQHHYPERLHTLWLFNAPMIFYGLWKLVYPFIDPVTRNKVKFVFDKDAEAEFTAAFDLDVLPPEICSTGTGRWISVRDQYEMLLRRGATLPSGGGRSANGAAAAATDGAAATINAGGAAVKVAQGQQGLGEGQEQGEEERQRVEVGPRPIEVVA